MSGVPGHPRNVNRALQLKSKSKGTVFLLMILPKWNVFYFKIFSKNKLYFVVEKQNKFSKFLCKNFNNITATIDGKSTNYK
jgi:hypothetical protein